jgi:hypothetical protein
MNPSDGKGIANSLLTQAKAELSFRRRVVELIGGVLKSDAPNYFKAFVVILLFLGLSASCILVTFFIAVILAILKIQQINPAMYAGILTGHGFVAVLLGAPLTMRMAALEEARRLETDLVRVQKIKQRKEATHRAAEPPGDEPPADEPPNDR